MDTWDVNTLDVKPHHPEVLRSDPEARVIAINLPAGERLQEHKVHERAYVVVVAGEVEFVEDSVVRSGGCGLVAHFQAGEPHEVRAKSDSMILLILAPWPGEGHPSLRAGQAG